MKRSKARQLDLFGNPIDEEPVGSQIQVLDFETHAVRMTMIKGEPWWVLADVARVLGYSHRNHTDRHLRDKEKGVANCDTLGGRQEISIINESGLYRLILRSNKPEAERFQDWVTEEILPTIRRTGSYTVRKDNTVNRTAKRLKVDIGTAVERVKNTDRNKMVHARMAEEGACPNDFANFHNAVYRGQFSVGCKALKESLRLSKRGTPLDRMSGLLLAQNSHAKWLADRIIRESAEPLAPSEQCEIAERLAHQITKADIATLGPGHRLGIIEDPKRGRVLDVVRALPA